MFKKGLIVVAILGAIGVALAWPKISLYLASVKHTSNNKTVAFFFDASVGLEGLADQLSEQKIISDKSALVKVGEYKELNAERLASGKYLIASATEYKTLLNGFTKNSNGNGNAEVEVEVTFNNCRDVNQLAGKVGKNLMFDSTAIATLLNDPKTLTKYGFTKEQLPALFLPNTYKMFWDTDPEAFLVRMADEFKAFWTPERKEKLAQIGLKSPSEAVTLASIVYSEQSRVAEEWPIIAGLYLNRIKQGIRLQSDPTFKFCWGDELKGVQRLTYKHRDIDCPYNTYYNNGLPPGPICIPPAAVVDAVLNREENKYIFMCAKPDYTGRHNFTVGYAEHAANALKFQRWLTVEQGKS